MRKEAWTYSLTAAILGALGVLIRWLQCQQIFEPDTGLAVKGAFVSVIMVLTLAAFAWALWWLSGKMDLEYTAPEPEEVKVYQPRHAVPSVTSSAPKRPASSAISAAAEAAARRERMTVDDILRSTRRRRPPQEPMQTVSPKNNRLSD